MKIYIFLFFVLFIVVCKAQNDTITRTRLDEIEIKGVKKHKKKRIGQKSIEITSNQVVKNPTTLTNLLRFNAPISFKDYGNGGVSTARFRGTSATNTLVLWNGIPINAFGSGQTDFNTLSANTSDEIVVNSGGGSTEKGSGAIGGTVQLNDKLQFNERQNFHLFSSYGSFETTSNFFKTNIGAKKWAIKLASSLNYSTNDYTYIDERYKDDTGNLYKNENGMYKNHGINFGLGYKFSDVNKLSFYTTGYYGNRFFSAGLPNPTSTSERNEDFNQRNLIKWEYNFLNFKQEINLSYLTQKYKYYRNRNAKNYDFGASKNSNFDYKLKYRFFNNLKVNFNFLYSKIIGETNKISFKQREVFALVGGVAFQPFKNTKTLFSVRKEFNSDFSIPVSLYLGWEQKVTSSFLVKSNFSKNYRVPTFNEMYWPRVGNPYLIPETSLQGEFGFEFLYKKLKLSSSAFYIHLDDKILWLPTGGTNLWRPKNIKKTVNKGIETSLFFSERISKNHKISILGNYVFTISENLETQKTLPFVPKHLFNLNIEYAVKWLKIYVQTLFQSKVYTNEINIDFYSLNRVFVNNAGVGFTVFKKQKNFLSVGVKVNNVQNSLYYFTNLRPMPERNFNININYKF